MTILLFSFIVDIDEIKKSDPCFSDIKSID